MAQYTFHVAISVKDLPTAISKMSTVVECFLQKAGQDNTNQQPQN